MKSMASRVGYTAPDPSDVADICFLIKHLGLGEAGQALDIVAGFYPKDQIPPRVAFLLEELFAEADL